MNLPQPIAEVDLNLTNRHIDSGRWYGTETLFSSFASLRFGDYFHYPQTCLASRTNRDILFKYSLEKPRPRVPPTRISFSWSVAVGDGVPKLKLDR